MTRGLRKSARAFPGLIRDEASDLETLEEGLPKTKTARDVKVMADTLENADLAVDDGIPPSAPSGVTATAMRRAVYAGWDMPPVGDRVRYTVVEYRVRAVGGGSPGPTQTIHTSGSAKGVLLPNLTPVGWEFRAAHVDQWGRQSAWSHPGAWFAATPQPSVADEIDLAEAEIAGTLGWENLEPLTDPDKVGDDVIVARTLASQNAAAINLWVENAAIQSAKVASLAFDKLDGGTIKAGAIMVVGGAKLRDNGIQLNDQATTHAVWPSDAGLDADFITAPLAAAGPSPPAGIGFWKTVGDAGYRGVLLTAEGRATNPDYGGWIGLRSGTGEKSVTSDKTAHVIVRSAVGAETHGSILFKGLPEFERAPRTSLDPTIDNHLIRKGWFDRLTLNYLDPPTGPLLLNSQQLQQVGAGTTGSHAVNKGQLDAVDDKFDVDTQTPSLAAGWSNTVDAVKIHKLGFGWVWSTGTVRNTSGSTKAQGSRIWTMQSDRRPAYANSYPCQRTNDTQNLLNNITAVVSVNPADGDVNINDSIAAGVEIDVSIIAYMAGL